MHVTVSQTELEQALANVILMCASACGVSRENGQPRTILHITHGKQQRLLRIPAIEGGIDAWP